MILTSFIFIGNSKTFLSSIENLQYLGSKRIWWFWWFLNNNLKIRYLIIDCPIFSWRSFYLDVPEFSEVEISLLLQTLDGESHVNELLGHLLHLRRHLSRHSASVRGWAGLGSTIGQAGLRGASWNNFELQWDWNIFLRLTGTIAWQLTTDSPATDHCRLWPGIVETGSAAPASSCTTQLVTSRSSWSSSSQSHATSHLISIVCWAKHKLVWINFSRGNEYLNHHSLPWRTCCTTAWTQNYPEISPSPVCPPELPCQH